ncbi:MAG: isocitrate lyase/PEP mutase family protein [Chloroflexi bacterium]|nr:isocitrate lyase/PEP mutase family protein [Chloroflexota bacterium]
MGNGRKLRELIEKPGLIVAPVCFNALTARIVEQLGFKVAYLGGYAFGSSAVISEPLTTMTEIVDAARHIANRISLPLVVDGDAGFGEPLHTLRAVREMTWAGVAGTHIEDQHFPKRASYHKDYQEHVIPLDEMIHKIKLAARGREADPDFVIIGRTDSMRTDGYDEGLKRAHAFLEAGADLIMLFPNNQEETERAARELPNKLVYVNSFGNRVGRPVLSTQELEQMGYKMLVDALTAVLVSVKATQDAYTALRDRGLSAVDQEEAIRLRKQIEDLIGLDEMYRIEAETVEIDS